MTYVRRNNELVESIAHPLQVLLSLGEVLAGNFDITISPLLESADASIFGRLWRPPCACEEFDFVDSFFVPQIELVNWYNDDTLFNCGVKFALVMHRAHDDGRLIGWRNKWFAECYGTASEQCLLRAQQLQTLTDQLWHLVFNQSHVL